MTTFIVLIALAYTIRKACLFAPKVARFGVENPKMVRGGMYLLKRVLHR